MNPELLDKPRLVNEPLILNNTRVTNASPIPSNPESINELVSIIGNQNNRMNHNHGNTHHTLVNALLFALVVLMPVWIELLLKVIK